ncbi:hypothetical protein FRC16_005055, partial [Serendipita sp. 398]
LTPAYRELIPALYPFFSPGTLHQVFYKRFSELEFVSEASFNRHVTSFNNYTKNFALFRDFQIALLKELPLDPKRMTDIIPEFWNLLTDDEYDAWFVLSCDMRKITTELMRPFRGGDVEAKKTELKARSEAAISSLEILVENLKSIQSEGLMHFLRQNPPSLPVFSHDPDPSDNANTSSPVPMTPSSRIENNGAVLLSDAAESLLNTSLHLPQNWLESLWDAPTARLETNSPFLSGNLEGGLPAELSASLLEQLGSAGSPDISFIGPSFPLDGSMFSNSSTVDFGLGFSSNHLWSEFPLESLPLGFPGIEPGIASFSDGCGSVNDCLPFYETNAFSFGPALSSIPSPAPNPDSLTGDDAILEFLIN